MDAQLFNSNPALWQVWPNQMALNHNEPLHSLLSRSKHREGQREEERARGTAGRREEGAVPGTFN